MSRALSWPLAAAMSLAAPALEAQPRRPPKAQPRPPPGTTIAVTVVEVTGREAYLQPGTAGGVHRGAKVVIGRSEYSVLQATASYAVIDVLKAPPREQEKGFASTVAEEDEKPRELPKPRPLASWEHAWPEAAAPASEQAPRFVPLGAAERDRRWDVRLSTSFGALLPLSHGPSTLRAGLDARVHAEPLAAPISFDLDLSVQRWAGSGIDARDGGGARPLVWLREMLVGYGAGGYYAGLGRMKYAASTLGTLDGTRMRAPLGQGFSIGAFGGVLPDPLGGEPSVAAQRFGVEASYSRPDLGARPEGALVVHGSTYKGSLDERRVSGVFGLYPGQARFGGHFEVSGFDSNNEWKASPVELTAGGLDASVRAGKFQAGARIDLRQPERSRWLASFLPTWWFCRPAPGAPGTPEPCGGSVATRALGAVDLGLELGQVSLTIGGTTINDLSQSGGAPDMRGGFVTGRVVRIAKTLRVDASGSYSQATYLEMFGGSAGPGVTLFGDALDVSAYYRNATLGYRALSSSVAQHGFGGAVTLLPSSVVLFVAQGEAITGSDVSAAMLFGTLMWRPRF